MDDLNALHALTAALGVHTRYTDGLGTPVEVSTETLVRVCAALGAPVTGPGDAVAALQAVEGMRRAQLVPPVVVAWDGVLPPIPVSGKVPTGVELTLEDGGGWPLQVRDGAVCASDLLPPGYHTLTVEAGALVDRCTVISAPVEAWRREGSRRGWGVGCHLAALRSARSRSLGDLRDLEALCRWVGGRGGDLVTALPLLPTFNDGEDPEPSPYAPVSRLFWSELILDLGAAHYPVEPPERLDVTQADAEVRRALDAMAGLPEPDPALLDDELVRYARFRGAQARLGRNWRAWPADARMGHLEPGHVDRVEERFHRVAQLMVRRQLGDLREAMDRAGVRLGLDLAVGAHPDGYDTWSRQGLFATGVSVGAPPDPGFPGGQDWGFPPVVPAESRREGHRYLAASVAHQAALSGVLRVDHVMAFSRLYWIPHGMGLHQGTYVSYPREELFAVLTLESHRTRCEVVGENLGTVPEEVDRALVRHGIRGMYLALFQGASPEPRPPAEGEVALIGTHDTPTLAGWVAGADIRERVRCGLLDEAEAPAELEARARAVERLAEAVGAPPDRVPAFLDRLLEWLGRSPAPMVIPWLEELWLEEEQVNLPGTRSSERPNWQRPMARLLDQVFTDPEVEERIRLLREARR